MKKFIKTFILAICLIFPSIFCLTACGGETAKVTSFSVELANTNYTLVEDTITVEYGEDYRLSFSDFSVTATFDDETSKILTPNELKDLGFTISSTIPNDEVTPVGEYTLNFGHKNLTETDYTTIKLNVTKKTIDVNTLNLTWTDEITPFVYDGQDHTNEITNLPEYLEVENYNGHREKYPNGAVVPGTYTNVPEKHYAVAAIRVKDEYADRYVIEGNTSIQHEWIIEKAEMSVPDIDFVDALENYTYNGAPITTKIKDEIKTQLENLNISTSLSGSETETNAEEYQVTISFTYTGEDKTCYNLGDEYLIGTRDTTWKIEKQRIDTSRVILKRSDGFDYTDTILKYSGKEQTVVFDVSSLESYLDASSGSAILTYVQSVDTGIYANTYTATITFTVNDDNYEVSDATVIRQWKINKRDLGVVADANQQFVYGTTQETISTSAKLAPIDEYGIDFVYNESEENKTKFYQILKDSITFEVRVDDYAKTAYTGKLNVGTYALYPVIPNGLTFDNYEVTSGGCVFFTITKVDLTLTINDKTNQSYWYNFDDMHAFTYDGNSKNYTINDVNATGLVSGDTLESLGLTFEYAKREFKVLDSVLSFTDSDDNLTWTTTAPINAGAYQVRAVIDTGNYNITSSAGKMLIMRKGVIITFADLTFDYGVKVSELNPTYTLGGEVHYHIGENHYQYVMGFDLETHIGYKPYNITSQEVISILSKLGITLNDEYRFGNYRWDEETDVDTFIPWELSDEDVVGTGTYQITFSQDILDELNSHTNYEFVIVEGRLTIDDE